MRTTKGILAGLLAAAVATLALAATAEAAFPTAFDGALTCTVAGDGHRECSGIVESFDGAPIDVNLGIPPEAGGSDGPYPLVMQFHGWGGEKFDVDQGWIDRGYAYFSMSDRGWGDSCGGSDPKRLDPVTCGAGYNHLLDTRYEVHDAQYLAGLLVDDGIADPAAIGAFGGSYGGGMSMALAALKNRVMMPDGSLVPWASPAGGTPIALAAAAPDIPWSDLAYSLLPTGRTLDYAAQSPYLPGDIGVMKQSFVTGLYGTGQADSNYPPPGSETDINAWYTFISAGEPYDGNPLAANIVDQVTKYHSSYYIDDSVAPAPLLISNGWTDDLFPPDEAIRYYNKTRAEHPGARVSLLFSDHGHQRGANKAADTAVREARRDAFFDFYLKGEGPDPGTSVETLTQTCPETAASGGPFTAPTWKQLAPGEIRYQEAAAKLISPEAGNPAQAQQFDPIAAGNNPCGTNGAAEVPGTASYRLDPAPAGGYTLMGSPTVVADILNLGPNSQLAARLLDVDPETDQQTLVARGLYRPADGGTAMRQVFQLHPNGYKFRKGHVAKLELLPNDVPYSRKSNGQTPITVSGLDLRLPVLEVPGSAGAGEPAPKVVPPGSEPAPGYDEPIDRDGDGIADEDDGCPDRAGPEDNDGCPIANPPDGDGDGIPDANDACPDDAGPVDNNGCPADGPGAGECGDSLVGTKGRDRIKGTREGERIVGRRGADRIRARAGDDCVAGGRGRDRINGGAGDDQIRGGRGRDRIKGGRGEDVIRGGRGRDRIRSRDGAPDLVRCGKGRDRVKADRQDRLRGCEKRRA